MSDSKGEQQLKDIIKRIALQKYGNGSYFLVTHTEGDRVRIELWNEEKTKILFLFEGEL
jgi:hypothetical protein